MPIISWARFEAEISQPIPPIEVRLLSYAMQALSTFSLGPEQRAASEKLYEQARYQLDVCERQESGESLTNINTLQACVLLTLYEFKRPNFSRAWITLARAIRLAKVMGLDKPDGAAGLMNDPRLCKPPAQPTTPADQEERRRAFWVLYIFDAFASRTTRVSDFRGPVIVFSMDVHPNLCTDRPSRFSCRYRAQRTPPTTPTDPSQCPPYNNTCPTGPTRPSCPPSPATC